MFIVILVIVKMRYWGNTFVSVNFLSINRVCHAQIFLCTPTLFWAHSHVNECQNNISDSPSFCLLCCFTVFASASWLNAAAFFPLLLFGHLCIYMPNHAGSFLQEKQIADYVMLRMIRMYEGGRKWGEREGEKKCAADILRESLVNTRWRKPRCGSEREREANRQPCCYFLGQQWDSGVG